MTDDELWGFLKEVVADEVVHWTVAVDEGGLALICKTSCGASLRRDWERAEIRTINVATFRRQVAELGQRIRDAN